MTTGLTEPSENLEKLNANLARVEELTQRLIQALAQKRAPNPSVEAPGQGLFVNAVNAYWKEAMENPGKLIEQQATFWGRTLKHYIDAQHALAAGKFSAPEDTSPKDRRFANPLWQTHPYFNFVKQQYFRNVEAMEQALAAIDELAPHERKRVEHFARQMMDMLAPTNFLGTNPDALERAVETEGESLVKGLENLVRDIEANRGDVLVTLADPDAFALGDNIGATEGAVVYRNRMLELIQYAATTDKVHATPVVIFPPWINKFYIMDLKPSNSLIKWIVDQGYTLFVVSWKNPDKSYADVGLDAYVDEGLIEAIEEVKKITGEKSVNAVGYCIAGTALTMAQAVLANRGEKSVKSATFFTTLTDFSDPGEVAVFLDDDFIDGIESQVAKDGYLDKYYMSRTFSFLRSNDLIYGPAIRSYMMGEAPPAFDLLYWNGDGTNLPARMAVEYLRWICQDNRLAEGKITICGETIGLKDVKVPLFAVACETDHIAPWKGSFHGIRQFGSKDKTFVVSQSGHIAGIINPPTKEKYGHYVNDAEMGDADEWLATASFNKGSWWPTWEAWLKKRSGRMVDARPLGDSKHPMMAPAPGTYVTETPII
ncbi:Poly(3-hydroxyalkanoate) polymerase subunit PhaC [Defluviimonas aquaemixtae]|uniref:Poly(3-hydroxyalkanoate) polymerase subunit PhaC n=1 Tax=Albidovulum aquaemixtae TaxID=1542388 RepID=A0A2R8B3B8_9RHOB|nr:class I poly(R)-hydroxyalkanoic acid synthase [Defluviimonas aquaemixtae]SPH17072.1 Poly(3-hydroxyalkanoate) polymerase subunit PhaC [Defluviimonas aquaemixtae]